MDFSVAHMPAAMGATEVKLACAASPDASATREAQDFVEAARKTTELPALTRLISQTAQAFGFDCVAMVHHVDARVHRTPVVAYSDYPMAYLSKVLERKYLADDPVLAASERTAAPFLWSDLPSLIRIDVRQREILAAAADAGIAQGFTVPINVPGEPPASCSFGLRGDRKMPEAALLATLWVAKFGFEQARRILGFTPSLSDRPRLSPRQHDCLLWVARGKSDVDTATILGLSRDTVHEHVQAAMRRYGVASRQQLLAACLADGQLTYADILDRSPRSGGYA